MTHSRYCARIAASGVSLAGSNFVELAELQRATRTTSASSGGTAPVRHLAVEFMPSGLHREMGSALNRDSMKPSANAASAGLAGAVAPVQVRLPAAAASREARRNAAAWITHGDGRRSMGTARIERCPRIVSAHRSIGCTPTEWRNSPRMSSWLPGRGGKGSPRAGGWRGSSGSVVSWSGSLGQDELAAACHLQQVTLGGVFDPDARARRRAVPCWSPRVPAPVDADGWRGTWPAVTLLYEWVASQTSNKNASHLRQRIKLAPDQCKPQSMIAKRPTARLRSERLHD